ncbi:hypothetical protein OC834_003623 [Tilletia horrida]|nr:hypothetical protein OC834_003623 [Tilletia horrida]
MAMPARPGAITGPAMATYALIRYFCSSLPPQTAAATSPLVSPLLIHIVKLIHGIDPPSPSLAHFRDCLDGALEGVPHALKANLFSSFNSWWAALSPSHWSIQKIFTQLDTCMQSHDEPELDMSMSKVRYVDRRSTLGMFLRRARIIYDKSDIHQQGLWAKMLCEWRDAGEEELVPHAGSSGLVDVPYPCQQAPATVTRMQAFDSYQAALRRGDYSAAKEHMFTFFDHTARGATREMHQHALLNLAALHLEMDSPAAAEPALHEAILLARTSKDWECVSACESLLKRVQSALSSEDQENEDAAQADESAQHFSTCKEREQDFGVLFGDASKLARRGKYEEALNLLLSSPLLSDMSMREHSVWQAQIWRVFWLHARRRGEEGAMDRIRALCQDVEQEDWVGRWERGERPVSQEQARTKGLGKGKGRAGVGVARAYVVLDAANRLLHEYVQRAQARARLDGIMPEILEDDDLEVRGIVAWVYAQTLLDDDASSDQINAACTWLRQALADFQSTDCTLRQGDVLYYLARLYDLSGDVGARDECAAELVRVESGAAAEGGRGGAGALERLLNEVAEVVSLLGANVAVGIPVA